MNIAKHPSLPGLIIAAWMALFAACTTQQTVPSGGAGALEQRAAAAREDGNLRLAAQLYRELAGTAQGTARAGYLLEAASVEIELGDTRAAAGLLVEADRDADRAQRQTATVLLADIDLSEGRAANALARLNTLEEPVDVEVMTQADAVRGRALFALGRSVEAVRTLAARETWLDTAPEILENQQMIWDGLAEAGAPAAPPTRDTIVDGWLALAPVAASNARGTELRQALADWRSRYANHPAAVGLLAELLGIEGGAEAYPSQIALLLPISTPQRSLAIAVRDGFLAAHFAARGEAAGETVIRIYDTGELGASEAYMRAQLEGADFIVGPLLRSNVEAVLDQAGLVPTLALNFVQADTAFVTGFYQFALWPEDEARAVARQAIDSGARSAVALVQSTEWGYRLLAAFREEFEALGGEFLGYNGYEETAQDFSAPIESLLNLDRSKRRRERLAANLGVNLAFEPRRRQDVDMIFLAVDPGAGRLVAPALRFHFAGDIPTYATSEIYDPGSGGRNGDLNGIYFPDAPLLLIPNPMSSDLKRSLESFWPQRTSSNIRLYGMGIDAYRLVGLLFGGSTAWPLDGVSGYLTLDDARRVRRVLPFAQFRNGRPVTLEPSRQLAPGDIGGDDIAEVEELAGFR